MFKQSLVALFALTAAACAANPPATGPSSPPEDAAADPGQATGDAPSQTDTDPASAKSESDKEFKLQDSSGVKDAHGVQPSKIKSTATAAAIKFIVTDKEKAPIEGIVISLTAPDGKKFYTEPTDAVGYAEVLVPVGKKYDLVYLALGKRDIETAVTVSDKPNQNIRLTLRYKRREAPAGSDSPPRIVLQGIQFDTAKAVIKPESFPELDRVVEYMTHKKSVRIEVSGHTDNVGNPRTNKTLSEKRAQAVRDYLISKGVDGGRIKAAGYGDEKPIAPNDTEEGRSRNRRIEATEN